MSDYPYFEMTDTGTFPAGTDIDAVLETADEQYLLAVWSTYHHSELIRSAMAKLADDATQAREGLASDLAKTAEVTATQALEANRRLVDLLTGRRWRVMRDAREAGDSWAAIGDALDMIETDARDWYKRTITAQEKYVGKWHDAERARAVLTDDEGNA